MNWKEFKNCIESKGITDDMIITNIDINLDMYGYDEIDVEIDGDEFEVY